METMVTAKVTIWDRIATAFWLIGFKLLSARRRKESRERLEDYITQQTLL